MGWIKEMLNAIGVVRGGPSRHFCLTQLKELLDDAPIHSGIYRDINIWILKLTKMNERGFRLGLVAVGQISGDDYLSWVQDNTNG